MSGADGVYETHVGFASGSANSFQTLLKTDTRWSELNFVRVWRARGTGRYDIHDVPDGIHHLATALSSRISGAVELLESARRIVGPNALVRAEIEKIAVASDVSDLDDQSAAAKLSEGFSFIGEFPRFESHISIRRTSRESVVPLHLERLLEEGCFGFNEIALAEGGMKFICTAFFESYADMFRDTGEAVHRLNQSLPGPVVIKASLERILCCAMFV